VIGGHDVGDVPVAGSVRTGGALPDGAIAGINVRACPARAIFGFQADGHRRSNVTVGPVLTIGVPGIPAPRRGEFR
jgi:hypothetical protein